MFIAIVDFQVKPEQRQAALEILNEDAAAARELPGNLSYRAFADAESADGVRIFHEWDTKDAFDHYAASPLFDRVGRQLKPMMSAAPISRRLNASLFEERRC